MIVYILIFAFGWGAKIAVDETDKYVTTSEIMQCYELTKDKLWLTDPCGPEKLPRSKLGAVVEVLNAQPNFWETLYQAKKEE